MDGVLPKDHAIDFAKSWVPPIVEASLDLHRAMHHYKYNEDIKIEDILESLSKLEMRKLCIILKEFVEAYQISVGIEPLDLDEDLEMNSEPSTDEYALPESILVNDIPVIGLA